MQNIKISIITPVKNGEKFIDECIKNVISQDHESLHEHIIVDGKSTDKTLEIIENYSRKYSKLKCFSERDTGQSHAMNKGIRLASGNIIGFLNVDDFYEDKVIAKVTKRLSSVLNPALIVGNCRTISLNEEESYIDYPKFVCFSDIVNNARYPRNPSSYFYHKEIHEMVGGYDENDHFAMDLDFFLRATQVANIYYVNELWGNFRETESSKTYRDRKNGYMRRKKIIEKYRTKHNMLKENNITFKKLTSNVFLE